MNGEDGFEAVFIIGCQQAIQYGNLMSDVHQP